MVLNAHSTLMMGRVGRFESNLMTFVVPVNSKLERRAIRLVQWLLEQNSTSSSSSPRERHSFEQVAAELQRVEREISPGNTAQRSVVLETFNRLHVSDIVNGVSLT